ncbi:MAG: hypothetical protein ACOZF2_05435 [Thermodesulfobacteriota bacterium]
MGHSLFHRHHKEVLQEAARIAEEMTSDFFKLTPNCWRRARYDILTLEDLEQAEISPHALALVAKYHGCPRDRVLKSAVFDFYRICLQDHNILKALDTCPDLSLLPLFLYILTHELVHVVRFSQFQALFEAPAGQRREEEKQVHLLAQKILKPLNSRELPRVIRYYEDNWQGGWQYAHL